MVRRIHRIVLLFVLLLGCAWMNYVQAEVDILRSKPPENNNPSPFISILSLIPVTRVAGMIVFTPSSP